MMTFEFFVGLFVVGILIRYGIPIAFKVSMFIGKFMLIGLAAAFTFALVFG